MKRNIKKILAGVVAITLIIFLLALANSLVGNPISQALAKKTAGKYIVENYNDLDLEIGECSYNFKFKRYQVFVTSPTSIDTRFSISFNSYGAVISDDYEYEVANNFTTLRRLEDELREIAKDIIGPKLDYDIEYISLSFVEGDDFLMKLKRDMTFDVQHPPLPLTINIDLFSNEVSYDKMAEIMKDLNALLIAQGIPVVEYNIQIIPMGNKLQREDRGASSEDSLSISNFPAERIDEENLALVMEVFEKARIDEMDDKEKEINEY